MEIKTMGILGSINTPINLKLLSNLNIPIIAYSQKIRIKIENNINAYVYKSGKIQIYGLNNIGKIDYIWNKTLTILSNYIDVSRADLSPNLKFIVATEKLPFKVNLQEVVEKIRNDNIEYEPEQFPGIIWRLKNGTCLLFSTGSCVITGANSIEKIEDIIDEVKNKLSNILKK